MDRTLCSPADVAQTNAFVEVGGRGDFGGKRGNSKSTNWYPLRLCYVIKDC